MDSCGKQKKSWVGKGRHCAVKHAWPRPQAIPWFALDLGCFWTIIPNWGRALISLPSHWSEPLPEGNVRLGWGSLFKWGMLCEAGFNYGCRLPAPPAAEEVQASVLRGRRPWEGPAQCPLGLRILSHLHKICKVSFVCCSIDKYSITGSSEMET